MLEIYQFLLVLKSMHPLKASQSLARTPEIAKQYHDTFFLCWTEKKKSAAKKCNAILVYLSQVWLFRLLFSKSMHLLRASQSLAWTLETAKQCHDVSFMLHCKLKSATKTYIQRNISLMFNRFPLLFSKSMHPLRASQSLARTLETATQCDQMSLMLNWRGRSATYKKHLRFGCFRLLFLKSMHPLRGSQSLARTPKICQTMASSDCDVNLKRKRVK